MQISPPRFTLPRRWPHSLGLILGLFCFLLAAAAQIAQPEAAPLNPPGVNPAGALAKPLQPAHEKAALITIDQTIDNVTVRSVERRIDLARKAGCSLIIFQIDATGGYLTSALELSTLIKHASADQMDVAAWLRGNGTGAATLVALACPQLVMADGALIGDIAPAGRTTAAAPLVTDLADSAKRNHIEPALLQAMVDRPLVIVDMKNTLSGEERFVEQQRGKTLADMVEEAPGGQKIRPWELLATVDDADQLLSLNPAQALTSGVSKATINSEAELRAAMNVRGELLPLDLNWLEKTARFLALPWVRFFLLVGMMSFAWMELSHPGVTIPGVLAVVCLALLLGGPWLTGLAQIWEILLIISGLLIILADLFIVGSLGMIAIPGFILMTIGLVASFIPASTTGFLDFGQGFVALRNGLLIVIMGTAASCIVFALLARYLRMVPAFKRLQLAPALAIPDAAGGVTDVAERIASEAVFLGALGISATQLRPAGKARFGDHLVDVVTDGGYINIGTEIEVIGINGNRVIVRSWRGAPLQSEPV